MKNKQQKVKTIFGIDIYKTKGIKDVCYFAYCPFCEFSTQVYPCSQYKKGVVNETQINVRELKGVLQHITSYSKKEVLFPDNKIINKHLQFLLKNTKIVIIKKREWITK